MIPKSILTIIPKEDLRNKILQVNQRMFFNMNLEDKKISEKAKAIIEIMEETTFSKLEKKTLISLCEVLIGEPIFPLMKKEYVRVEEFSMYFDKTDNTICLPVNINEDEENTVYFILDDESNTNISESSFDPELLKDDIREATPKEIDKFLNLLYK